MADDSGLSVDALGGGPGLYSSRFGGEGASDADRNRLLLEKLASVPPPERGARFTSAVALAQDGTILFTTEQSVEGRIAEEPRGENGFGYDPLFFYPPFGTTFGEASARGQGPGEPSRPGLQAAARVPGRSFLNQWMSFLEGLVTRER